MGVNYAVCSDEDALKISAPTTRNLQVMLSNIDFLKELV